MSLLAAPVFCVFGLASIAGGVFGFKKAGSRASLIAGGISGALLLAAAGMISGGSTLLGFALGGGISLLLGMRFAPAFMKTRKWMPAGMMTVLSGVGAVTGLLGLLD